MAHARDNNFDLIRLLAAAQVFIMHAIAWLQVPASHIFLEVMDWFPGVPVFFMISGYLVTASFVRSPSTIEYLRNRVLRIFPGLWVCLVLTYVLVLLRGGLAESNLLSKTVAWFIANATLFQFAGAAGTGVENGALWSISTELQFYLLMPVAVLLVAKSALSRLMTSLLIMFGIALSGAFHDLVLSAEARLHPWVYATLYASVLTNGFLFLLGVLAYLWRERLLPFVSNKALFF